MAYWFRMLWSWRNNRRGLIVVFFFFLFFVFFFGHRRSQRRLWRCFCTLVTKTKFKDQVLTPRCFSSEMRKGKWARKKLHLLQLNRRTIYNLVISSAHIRRWIQATVWNIMTRKIFLTSWNFQNLVIFHWAQKQWASHLICESSMLLKSMNIFFKCYKAFNLYRAACQPIDWYFVDQKQAMLCLRIRACVWIWY